MEDNKTRSLFTREITSMPEKGNQVRCMGCMEEFSEEFALCPNCGYVVGTAPKMKTYLRPGTILSGNYMLGRVIGQGGFGITYIAWDKMSNRKVAVKEFFPSSLSTREDGETHVVCYSGKAEQYFKEGVKKMLDEGNRLSRFKGNPNIVNVYDYFEENGTAYIVMEYLDGKNLKEYADEKGGRLDPREAVNLMMPVIGALEEMHKENMIHRDIAPDNIYICEDGRIKLLDFGSARIAVQDAEKSLSVMVKPGYAPKEQYASRSKQGPWTDVYSVCATIYRLVTGESPVESIERENIPLKTFAEFGIAGHNDIENIIFRGLEPEPENRIRSAETLGKLFLNVLAGDASFNYFTQPTEEYESHGSAKKGKGKKIAMIIFSVLAVILLLGGIITGVLFFVNRLNGSDTTDASDGSDITDEGLVESQKTSLSIGENSMYYDMSGSMRYTFLAEGAGFYTFESNTSDYVDLNCKLWKSGTMLAENDGSNGMDFSIFYYLDAGDTVTLVVDNNGEYSEYININVSYVSTSLSLGNNDMYYNPLVEMRYTFYAEKAGNYIFKSNSYADGAGNDFKCELWKNGSKLAENDNYNDDCDFLIDQYLSAGETVTLVVKESGSEATNIIIDVSHVSYELSQGSNVMYFGKAFGEEATYTFVPESTGYYAFALNNPEDKLKISLSCNGEILSNDYFVAESDKTDFKAVGYFLAGSNATLDVYSLNEYLTENVNIEVSEITEEYYVATQMYEIFKENGYYLDKAETVYKYNPRKNSAQVQYAESSIRIPQSCEFTDNTLWMEFDIWNNSEGRYSVWYPIYISSNIKNAYYTFVEYEKNGIHMDTDTMLYLNFPSYDQNYTYWTTEDDKHPNTFAIVNGKLWFGFDSTNNGSDTVVWYPM